VKYICTAVLFILSFSVFAEYIDSCPSFKAHGSPVSGKKHSIPLCKIQYYNEYDTVCKTTVVVAEHLTNETLSGNISRENFSFHVDRQLPIIFRVSPSDYYNTGYDMGHMSPAEYNRVSAAVMYDSFNLTNAVPQTPNNNRGVWRELEMNTKLLAKKLGDLYVYSGPINSPNPKTLKGGECIPDYTYKILYSKSKNVGAAFIVPNTSTASDKRYTEYEVSILEVEKRTGINFFPEAKDVKFKETVKAKF